MQCGGLYLSILDKRRPEDCMLLSVLLDPATGHLHLGV